MLDEKFYRLALQYQPNWGNIMIKKLLQICETATNIFERPALYRHLISNWNRTIQPPHVNSTITNMVEQDIMNMEKNGIKLCFYTDENFPKRLKCCHDSPILFYYKGESIFNTAKAVAIVGTRNASVYGKDCVRKIVSDLINQEICIISGLASGIDTVAHEQAIATHLKTIAVMGSGFYNIYPPENKKLANTILEHGGCIISEYPYETRPDRQNFPKRNRIIAGLVDAVLVAETASKGGSIITAYIAHSYNRDVFAVPGSIFSKYQTGCHELIRANMAALCYSGDNLIRMMGWDLEPVKNIQPSLFIEFSDKEEVVMNIIRKNKTISIDDIHYNLPQFTPSQVASILLGLEIKGAIECKPGKIYQANL